MGSAKLKLFRIGISMIAIRGMNKNMALIILSGPCFSTCFRTGMLNLYQFNLDA
jgi:hypothetical protein